MEQQPTAISNLIFVENEKIDLRWAGTRITLRKKKKKKKKKRVIIIKNKTSLLVESEQDGGKIITHTLITHYKNYAQKYLYTLDKAYQGHLNSLNRHNMDIFDYLLRLYPRQMEKRRHKSLKSPHFFNFFFFN